MTTPLLANDAPAIQDPGTLAGPLTDVITGLVKALRRDLVTTGTSLAQARILGALHDRGAMRICDLTALEQVAQPTMTALVTRMQRQGLVTRSADLADRRAVAVALTPLGNRVYDEVSVLRRESMTRALSELPPDDLAGIASALSALQRLHALASSASA